MDATPRLLKVEHLDYIKAVAGDSVDPGYVVIGDRVLVLVDEVANTTSGGILLTGDVVEKQNARSQTGVIVGLGDAAFRWTFDRTREWYGKRPEVGTRIYFERYAGAFIPGGDGKFYRIMDDKCVSAIEISPESVGTEKADPKAFDVVI